MGVKKWGQRPVRTRCNAFCEYICTLEGQVHFGDISAYVLKWFKGVTMRKVCAFRLPYTKTEHVFMRH